MRYLKTYESMFTLIKDDPEITSGCRDILLDLRDNGYKTIVRFQPKYISIIIRNNSEFGADDIMETTYRLCNFLEEFGFFFLPEKVWDKDVDRGFRIKKEFEYSTRSDKCWCEINFVKNKTIQDLDGWFRSRGYNPTKFNYNESLLEKAGISFSKQPKKAGAKTDVYNVVKGKTTLGQIKWSSRMRGYGFLPTKDCDSKVKEFIKDLMAKRRAEKKKSK